MAENTENQQDVQEPEKPKKKSGGMSTLQLILIIGGMLVVLAVAVIIALKIILAPEPVDDGKGKKDKTEKVNSEDEEFFSDEESDEADFFADESKRKYMETGRITTNPKLSTKFVIINLGLVYRAKDDVPEEALSPDSDLMKKIHSRLKAIIIKEIGDMTPEELMEKRSTIDIHFRDKLRPMFKEAKIFLREVNITEFMMQ